MEALSYCQLMERCLAAEARVVELAAENALRQKFEAWVMSQIRISKSTLEGLRTADGYRNTTLSGTDYNRMWNCWKAAGAELVEALEKAWQRIAELESGKVGNALLERENHHVEVVGKLTERIAELESRTVKLPDSNNERFWGYGAEFEIKLYDSCVFHALTTADIKWEVE